ncbi:UNVERIFIED_CONTAM: protease-4 [Acetivibrio alkalicellulosi]
MNTKRWIAVGAFCGLLFIQILSSFVTSSDTFAGFEGANWSTEVYRRGIRGNIAILEINGAIMESDSTSFLSTETYRHKEFLEQLEHVFKNDSINGVVLKVNSPGGGVFESDEIHRKIVSLKEENDKPFVVYMGKLAASGGYYVSAPADKIYADRNTITGSIGVIIGNLNFKELMDNIGIEENSIVSGKNKNILSPYQHMSDEQRQIIQSMVDEIHEQFLDVVSQGRNIEKSKLRSIADGRIYSASQAKDVGLIDEIGTLDDAIDEVASRAELSNPNVLKYKHDSLGFLSSFLGDFKGTIFSRRSIGLSELEKQVLDTEYSLPMYLWKQ